MGEPVAGVHCLGEPADQSAHTTRSIMAPFKFHALGLISAGAERAPPQKNVSLVSNKAVACRTVASLTTVHLVR